MKRTTRLTLLLALLGLVLAACGGANVAATVNGVEINDGEVLALAERSGDEAVTDAEGFRNLLTNAILTEAMVTAAESEFGLENIDSQETVDVFIAGASPDELGILQSVAANPGLSEDAVDLVATQLLVRSTVKEQIANDPEFLEAVWQDNQNLLIQACASHILVASEEESQAVRERLEAGEDFAALAAEVSLDVQSPGGVLPCPVNPSVFIEPFSSVVATAPVGEPVGPVETQFGWHIIVVDSREFPQSLDELAADPTRWVPSELLDAAWSNWLNDSVADADIDVRSQIGMWHSPVDGIRPPLPSP
ncbi:MAG: peptidylprolyl isomerase [Actinomycetia bacterium]|nr:peptidylprolyl isomerase [Actinomycetes bacterium]